MIVDARIASPNALFACPARKPGESERAVQTLQPLAAKLGLPINTRFGRGDEAALAIAATETEGTVLIAWEHKALPGLARAIVGKHVSVPEHWPSERFDVIWLLEQMEHAQPWYFRQVPQLLLAGDAGVAPEANRSLCKKGEPRLAFFYQTRAALRLKSDRAPGRPGRCVRPSR